MNARERFDCIMHYQDRDRCPIMDFGYWNDTVVLWREQGLPKQIEDDVLATGAQDRRRARNPKFPVAIPTVDAYFGLDPQWYCAPVLCGLQPPFDFEILEDRGESEIVRDIDGVTQERTKVFGSIPKHLDHLLKDRASWTEHFAPRLNGAYSGRYPSDWETRVAEYRSPKRDYPLGLVVGSVYGWLREWMGLENISLLVYDDLALFEEMVATLTDCVIQSITPALESGVEFQYAHFWEDMCYRAGPLLSPKIFEKVCVPNYRRITSLLKSYGIDIVVLDSDGDITKLIPLWLDAGVNCLMPIEVGVWGADPIKLRARYGRDLRMIGGFDKRILARGRSEITREIERLATLVEEGGYIPMPDHKVPPDVPLSSYAHYLNDARRVWGKNAASLAPMNVRPTGSPMS